MHILFMVVDTLQTQRDLFADTSAAAPPTPAPHPPRGVAQQMSLSCGGGGGGIDRYRRPSNQSNASQMSGHVDAPTLCAAASTCCQFSSILLMNPLSILYWVIAEWCDVTQSGRWIDTNL